MFAHAHIRTGIRLFAAPARLPLPTTHRVQSHWVAGRGDGLVQSRNGCGGAANGSEQKMTPIRGTLRLHTLLISARCLATRRYGVYERWNWVWPVSALQTSNSVAGVARAHSRPAHAFMKMPRKKGPLATRTQTGRWITAGLCTMTRRLTWHCLSP